MMPFQQNTMIQHNNFQDMSNYSKVMPVQKINATYNSFNENDEYNHHYSSNSSSSSYNTNHHSNTNNNNSNATMNNYLQNEIRLLKEENIKLKQRMNNFELREDTNDIKIDEIEMKVMQLKANGGFGDQEKKDNSIVENDLNDEKAATFDEELFPAYISEKSGLWANLLLKCDRPKHYWVQQLRSEFFFFFFFVLLLLFSGIFLIQRKLKCAIKK
jgi:hypothetical protein